MAPPPLPHPAPAPRLTAPPPRHAAPPLHAPPAWFVPELALAPLGAPEAARGDARLHGLVSYAYGGEEALMAEIMAGVDGCADVCARDAVVCASDSVVSLCVVF